MNDLYEYSILEARGMYEAFKYFEMGNPKIGEFLSKDETKIIKHHYVKQDIGYKFIYMYKNFALKFIQTSDYIININVCRYEIENDNEIVKSKMNFDYNILYNDIIRCNKIETEFGNCDINKQKILK